MFKRLEKNNYVLLKVYRLIALLNTLNKTIELLVDLPLDRRIKIYSLLP